MMTTKKAVVGRVVDRRGGQALAGLRVEVWRAGRLVGTASTDDEGAFTIAVGSEPGEVEVSIRVLEGNRLLHRTLAVRAHSKTHVLRVARPVERLVGLVTAPSGAPVTGYTVETIGSDGKVFGRDTTRAGGLFTVVLPHGTSGPVAVRVVDAAKKEVAQQSVTVGTQSLASVRFDLPAGALPRTGVPLAQITDPGIAVPQELVQFLAGKGFHTLDDVRAAGDLASLGGLPVPAESAAVRTLQAHADLAAISSDIPTNAALIAKGFDSVRAIAEAPADFFRAQAPAALQGAGAERMQYVAGAHTQVLDHARAVGAIDSTIVWQNAPDKGTPKLQQPSCDCACQSVVSPVAYLVDLLDFAVKRITDGGALITLPALVAKMLQPFDQLIVACDALEAPIRQVRIAVEVLRAAAGKAS